jgi:hypothetical protein
MNYPYPRFFLDVELAKRGLVQVLATRPGIPGDELAPPSNKDMRENGKVRKKKGTPASALVH